MWLSEDQPEEFFGLVGWFWIWIVSVLDLLGGSGSSGFGLVGWFWIWIVSVLDLLVGSGFWFLSLMLLLRLVWALTAAAGCVLLLLVLHNQVLREGLPAGSCEVVTLDRDRSSPRWTIARQTARCACRKGQIAGTTRARPACVDVGVVETRQWCRMFPCLDDEGCDLLVNQSGWTCTQPGGRVKTTTVS